MGDRETQFGDQEGEWGLSGGDLDKDTLAFGAKGRWETWQDRGINRDANLHGTRSSLRKEEGEGVGVWMPAGPLRTEELLSFLEGWDAPSFCLPSPDSPLPPSFTFLGICRAQMGAPGVFRAPAPAGWCKQAQSEMGGWERGRGV